MNCELRGAVFVRYIYTHTNTIILYKQIYTDIFDTESERNRERERVEQRQKGVDENPLERLKAEKRGERVESS